MFSPIVEIILDGKTINASNEYPIIFGKQA